MSINDVKHSNGFTLIEILITVLILSIGLLGLAGLQVSSMKSNHSSYLRTQATILAYDIIDRMRSNPDSVIDAATNTTKNDYVATNNAPAVVAACTQVAGTCNPADMANTDINQWRAALAAQLPNGQGAICLDDSPDDGTSPSAAQCSSGTNEVFAIKIWWTDDRTGTPKRFVTSYAP